MQQAMFIKATQDKSAWEAWQEGIAQHSQQNPSFKHQLIQQQGELLARFAKHYNKLKGRSRQMRRALQRK